MKTLNTLQDRCRRASSLNTTLVVRSGRPFGCVLLAMLAGANSGAASYGLGTSATAPTLRADSKGNAEVSWAQGAARQTFIVPKSGEGYHGSLAGVDVSKPANVALPMAVVVRKTPDETFWALQQLAVSGRPTALDVSRWQGAPTQLRLTTDGKRITGSATFHGRPVTGSSPTLAGKKVRVYVYLECFGCAGQPRGWMLMLGVPPKADGSFSVDLRSSWVGHQYRATVAGQNIHGELAPDAQTVINAGP
jgi:hypothetical protein